MRTTFTLRDRAGLAGMVLAAAAVALYPAGLAVAGVPVDLVLALAAFGLAGVAILADRAPSPAR